MNRILTCLILVLSYIYSPVYATTESKGETYRWLSVFSEAFKKVREHYVKTVTDQLLIEAALQGMLQSLDSHSEYLDQNNYAAAKTKMKGEYGGIGIEVGKNEDAFTIISIIKNSPAAKAGLKKNDQLIAVDDSEINELPLTEVIQKLRGHVGEKVKVTIKRGDFPPIEKTLTKEHIQSHQLLWELIDNIVYIRLPSFHMDNTAKLLKERLVKLKKEHGNHIKGLVLDVRDNVGGLFDQAIDVANLFLDEKTIVLKQGRSVDDQKRFSAGKGAFFKDLPIIVLINKGTASSAEIFAAALHDNNVALLVGETTYGKASVQSLLPLNSGVEALRLTTNYYFRPNGNPIDKEGLTPTIALKGSPLTEEGSPSQDQIKIQALNIMKGLIAHQVLNKERANDK